MLQQVDIPQMDANTIPNDSSPERRLMAAVLWRAIHDLLPQKATELTDNNHKADAYDWIFISPHRHLHSFLNICTELGFDADSMRSTIERMIGTMEPGQKHPLAKKQLWRITV